MSETHWKPWVAQDDDTVPCAGPVAVLYQNGTCAEFPDARKMTGFGTRCPEGHQIVAYSQLEEVSVGSWGRSRLDTLSALRDQPAPNPSDRIKGVSPEEAERTARYWDSEQHRRGEA